MVYGLGVTLLPVPRPFLELATTSTGENKGDDKAYAVRGEMMHLSRLRSGGGVQ